MSNRMWVRVWQAMVLSVLLAFGCSRGPSKSDEDVGSARAAVVVSNDFENGTLQGWVPRGPVTLTNSTEQAADGTRSLKTTGRTAGFHGPSLNALPFLVRGATYQISVKVRLVTGEAPTTVRLTMQQTPAGGSNQFVTIAQNTNVTDAAWVTLTGTYSFSTDMTGLLLYVEATSATASYYIDSFSITELTPPPAVNILHTWEDGTLQGWVPRGPVTLTNTTEAAGDGLRSLKTTNRTQGFHGPSLNVLGVLRKGATYQVSVKVRLVTGTPSSTVRVTVQRTPLGGSSAFDTVASNSAVTDAAFVTMAGIYSFSTDVSGLILYVESTNVTASYYIDTFSLVEIAPPPGPPGNTTGAVATFESGTAEGWFSRTGVEVVAVSSADAHAGTRSLLTTNRTSSFRGPAFNVTNVMFNGSRYRVTLWAKLAPGEVDTTLRVSLERRLGTNPSSFHTLIGNQTVTSGAWVRFVTTFDMNLANTQLTLYVESNSGAPLSSFYIDDFQISFVPPPVAERDIPSVYQSLTAHFPVGAAIHAGDLTGEHAFLLTKHFNSVTSENDMKWSSLQGTQGAFTFATADAQVAFAKANNMRIRGHTLVWHAQTPAWVFNDASGNPLTPTPENKALLLSRMETHIRAVVTHFGSDIYAWDVVNEVIDPSQADGWRRSPWFNVIGPEFVDRAFQVAREVAPNAELYINDFDTTNTVKRQHLFNLMSDLRSRGIPVDGIGHQMHNNVDFPSGQAVIDTIDMFHNLGVKNEITELDVSIYSNSFPGPVLDYFDIPAERLILQGYRYRTFFQAFRQLQGKIASVTFWGQADDHTWLTSAARVNAPLLFDQSLIKKHAYWGVMDPLQLPGADLASSVDPSSPTVEVGQAMAFTIAAENLGDENDASFMPADDDLPADNVSLVSPIAAHTVFQSLTAPAGWTCTTPPVGGSGQLSCQRASLAVNASEAFTLSVLAASCATPEGTTILQSANITSSTRDPNLAPNNASSATALVSNPPPVVSLIGEPSMTLECGMSFSDPGATAVDACDGPVAVTSSGTVDVNQVGTYAVRYDASDSAGGLASRVRAVNVVDTTAPTVVLKSPSLLTCGQPLHQYKSFSVADFVASVADCDANATVVIESVTSDEPEDAPGGEDGKTLNDIVISGDCQSVQLRSERNASGNGRVYTVTLRIRDASGNSTVASVRVNVPKNPGDGAHGTAVDDGPRYSVAGNCQ